MDLGSELIAFWEPLVLVDAVVVEQDDVAVAINMDHIGHNCSPGEPTSDPMEASVASV